MADRFPDYDVLAKRGTLSWNDRTRAVIDERLSLAERADVLNGAQRETLHAVAARIVPQPEGRAPVNLSAILLDRLTEGESMDGYRHAALPPALDAWRRGLDAIEAEARARHGLSFARLGAARADELLRQVEAGRAADPAWGNMPPALFWSWRLLPDLVSAYWSHPSAWSAMGFGGPAAPRGYVRLGTDRRDPWEAEEKHVG